LILYIPLGQNSKEAAVDDTLPDGTKVKKGNIVGYVPYSMGRMKFLWGEDALEFRPERWLKLGHFQPESPFKFTAFQVSAHHYFHP
jgi:cytochrome P450